jgi:hypothetical protein
MRTVAALLLAAALAACAGQHKSLGDVNDDKAQITRAANGDADFIAMVPNRRTVMFNGDLWADRVSLVSSRLKLIGCREPRMLREQAQGEGGDRVVYWSAWKCG